MGDRVHANFRLGGHVETVEELEILMDAIVDEMVVDLHLDFRIKNHEDAKTSLRNALEAKFEPSFYDNDVNYGTFESIEAAVEEVSGLAAHFTWEAGGGFDAGMKTILPDGEEVRAEGGEDPAISLSQLVQARQSDNVLRALDDIIEAARKAGGLTMPAFTASPAIHAYLKILGGKP